MYYRYLFNIYMIRHISLLFFKAPKAVGCCTSVQLFFFIAIESFQRLLPTSVVGAGVLQTM